MGILKILFIVLMLAFPLGEIARFQTANGIAVTLNDLMVFLFVATGLIINIKNNNKFNYPLLKPIIMFAAICLISLIFNASTFSSNQIIVASLYLLRWIFYSGIYFVVGSFDDNFKKNIPYILVLPGIIMIVFGYIQYFFYSNLGNLFYSGWDEHMYRMFSSFLDPNFYGTFLVLYLMLIFSILIYYLKIKKLRSSLVIFIFILFTLHAIFLTYSRSTLIMFLVSSITMAILIRKKKIILIIFGLLFLVFFMSYKDFYIENINLFRVVSSKARIYSMENALQIIKDHPLIGVGFNTYRYTQIKYGFRGGKVAEYSHADAGTDNSFLFVLATTGIIGFGAYIYLFWSVLLSAKSKMEDKKKMLQPVIPFVLIASLVGLFFNALLINSLFFPFLMEWIWILLGITSTSIKKIKESS